MKKFILMAMLAAGSTAFADDYKFLGVDCNNAETYIALENIKKITFESGNVVVATSEGQSVFPQSKMERMFFSETATAIEEVAAEEDKTNGKEIFDLTGRRVARATKGIYIVNGKKVVVK